MWKKLLLSIIRKTIQEEVRRLLEEKIRKLIEEIIQKEMGKHLNLKEEEGLREIDNGVEFRVPIKPMLVRANYEDVLQEAKILNGANVKDWEVKYNDLKVEVDDKHIYFHTKIVDDLIPIGNVVANPWVIVRYNGKYYASTFEWLRPKQKIKDKRCVAGDHIKRKPLRKWKPKKGDILYFFVAGLSRGNKRNEKVRTNIVAVEWK